MNLKTEIKIENISDNLLLLLVGCALFLYYSILINESLILPDSISPKQLGINEDIRPFSFSFQEILFSTSLINETYKEM